MKISKKAGFLCIDCGLFLAKYELSISEVVGWEFVAKANGATYFTFSFFDSTQHVSFPILAPAQLLEVMESIEGILGKQAKLSISERRVADEYFCLASEISLGLLVLVIASARV